MDCQRDEVSIADCVETTFSTDSFFYFFLCVCVARVVVSCYFSIS